VNGQQQEVHYAGLDVPRAPDQGGPAECFGEEARAANTQLVQGKMVRMVLVPGLADPQGRPQAWAYLGDVLVNAELVRTGFAAVQSTPDQQRTQQLADLQQQAQAQRAGIWGACSGPHTPAGAAPAAAQTPAPAGAPTSGAPAATTSPAAAPTP
jgi:endonuclease YncB( thermonuclease family)